MPIDWHTALRYVELNAVRAHMARSAGAYACSSAPAHLGLVKAPGWLDVNQFEQRWPTPANWKESLATLTRREAADLRRATRHDSALGSDAFIDNLEHTHPGNPRKSSASPGIPELAATCCSINHLLPRKCGGPGPHRVFEPSNPAIMAELATLGFFKR